MSQEMKLPNSKIIPFRLEGRAWVEMLLRSPKFRLLEHKVYFEESFLSVTISFNFSEIFSSEPGKPEPSFDEKMSAISAYVQDVCCDIFKDTSFTYADSCAVNGEPTYMRSYDLEYQSPQFQTDISTVFERILTL